MYVEKIRCVKIWLHGEHSMGSILCWFSVWTVCFYVHPSLSVSHTAVWSGAARAKGFQLRQQQQQQQQLRRGRPETRSLEHLQVRTSSAAVFVVDLQLFLLNQLQKCCRDYNKRLTIIDYDTAVRVWENTVDVQNHMSIFITGFIVFCLQHFFGFCLLLII